MRLQLQAIQYFRLLGSTIFVGAVHSSKVRAAGLQSGGWGGGCPPWGVWQYPRKRAGRRSPALCWVALRDLDFSELTKDESSFPQSSRHTDQALKHNLLLLSVLHGENPVQCHSQEPTNVAVVGITKRLSTPK